ncbi:MAG TPA: hypothetical protein PKX56_05430 [Marmoricola sp.]|nr:hypothetical protein [Marmoricola sp.]HNJ78777.1 hypothetical protein [Marmoricola sp.]
MKNSRIAVVLTSLLLHACLLPQPVVATPAEVAERSIIQRADVGQHPAKRKKVQGEGQEEEASQEAPSL